VRAASWTGRARSWTQPACGRKGGGELTGPDPVDRGKPGSKLHLLSDANGLPLVAGVTAANTHDNAMFIPLLDDIPAIRSRRAPRRRRPAKLHADKGYDAEDLRAECRRRGIAPPIARRGIESGERLGRWRWKIERSISRAPGYRRLTVR
jgi:transposase